MINKDLCSMKVLANTSKIKYYVDKVSKEINKNQPNDGLPSIFVCMLNGGVVFFSDLIRKIEFPIQCEFMKPKSYSGKEQSEVELLLDLNMDVANKHIYLIDDFIDSGNTLKYVAQHLQERNPKSITAVTLLSRQNPPDIGIPLISGIKLNEEWVVGYGLDGEGGYSRNLPQIYEI